jgi:hypothetical protein
MKDLIEKVDTVFTRLMRAFWVVAGIGFIAFMFWVILTALVN